ncbi:MAG TPA: ATP synthase F1 subunit gamma [Candidatus Limnocylindrales bacterium]|nr:ATP synthase F1 subunit gamma [Candidatus Limnocylindrales bacterium]
MPNLKQTRKRIASVRSTQQITKAMKMVSAAKLRRAQEAAEKARPYGTRLNELLASVAASAGDGSHPFLEPGAAKPAELVVVTSDRGLCGGYNTNLIKTAEIFLRSEAGQGATVVACGRRGDDYFRRHYPQRITAHFINQPYTLALAREVAALVSKRFREHEVGSVHLVSSKFRSAISQFPVREQLLPVERSAETEGNAEYLFEPEAAELLGTLLERYVDTKIFQAFLESTASEHGARMTAMDSATRNASDMIERLTLQMNRARQATITTELMEIVGGAEALKG